MARIAVIGGSGYAGRHIVAEAVSRGHSVLSIARRIPAERHAGAIYVEGSLTDVPDLLAQIEGVDVVVSAVAPRGEMQGLVRSNIGALVSLLPLIWSMFTHTEANAVQVVGTIAANPASPVKGVITAPTVAGRELAQSIPGPQVVQAGSTDAKAMANIGATS